MDEIYQGIEMGYLSQARAAIQLRKVPYSISQIIVTLDTDESPYVASSDDASGTQLLTSTDSGSDPKLYIFDGLGNSTFCGSFGSKVCPLPYNIVGTNLTSLLITCQQQCKFTLKVSAVYQSTNIADVSGTKNQSFYWSEARSFNIFDIDITANMFKNATSLSFLVETNAIVKSSIDMYYAIIPIDKYLDLSTDLDTSVQKGLTTERGKLLLISLRDDPLTVNTCMSGCTLYVAVRAKNPLRSYIKARLFYKDDAMNRMPNQEYTNIALFPQLSINDITQLSQCWPFMIEKSLYDVVYEVQTYSGDETEWAAIQKNNDDGTSYLLMRTESAVNHQIVVRSTDIWRNGEPPQNKLIYICAAKVLTTTTVSIKPIGKDWFQRLNLKEEVKNTFVLGTKDYLTFVYSNAWLPLESQNLTVSMVLFSEVAKQSVPRLFYKICAYPDPDDCYLNEQQAISISSMTGLEGLSDDLSKSKVATIRHTPKVCNYTEGCNYLISVYNPDNYGPVRVTLKLTNSLMSTTNLRVFQQYQGMVDYGMSQYFAVSFTPQQLSTLSFSKLRVSVSSFNGRAELYGSSRERNPRFSFSEVSAAGLSRLQAFEYDLSQVSDLYLFKFYIGVYGTQSTTFLLKVDAVYSSLYPEEFASPEATLSPMDLLLKQVPASQIISSDNPLRYINLTGAAVTAQNQTVYYRTANDLIKTVLVVPTFERVSGSVSLVYNITKLSNDGSVTALTNQIGQIVLNAITIGSFNSSNVFKIDFKLVISPPTEPSQASLKFSLQLLPLKTDREGIRDRWDVDSDLTLGQTYESYGNTETVNYRRIMMDSAAIYEFKLTNLLGTISMMLHIGPMVRKIKVADDLSYDYAKVSLTVGETISIKLDSAMRNKTSRYCGNGTFSLVGGNENCTIYVGVQCNEMCAYQLSANLTGNRSLIAIAEPQLIKEKESFSGILEKPKQAKYYFVPYRRISAQDCIFALTKQQNTSDSILVARLFSKAYMPYQNWPFPNGTSYDFISQSGPGINEVLELPQSLLQSKCLGNASCVIILGVVNTNVTNSSYTFTRMDLGRKMPLNQTISSVIYDGGTYEYYWFIVQNKGLAKGERLKWSHLITAHTNNINTQVGIFISQMGKALPTMDNADYRSGFSQGPKFINMTSSDHQASKAGSKIIFYVGFHAKQSNTRYQILNWGPSSLADQAWNVTDLAFNQTTLKLFDQRYLNGTYQTFRYFNFGTRDIRMTITTLNGGVYLLLNNQPLRSQLQVPRDYQEALDQGSFTATYTGTLPVIEGTRDPKLNPFFNLPIFNETSLMKPIEIKANSTFLLELSLYSNYNGLWCQFCWYYITVVPLYVPPVVVKKGKPAVYKNTSVWLNVNEMQYGASAIEEIKSRRENYQYNITLSGQKVMKRFILASLDPIKLLVSDENKGPITVQITMYPDNLGNQMVWQAQGSGMQVFSHQYPMALLQTGVYYYVIVTAGANSQSININLWQERQIFSLRNMTSFTDKILHGDDFVKYFYLLSPNPTFNYSVSMTVNSKAPGFMPIIYMLRNDAINGSIATQDLKYPSPALFTRKIENSFFVSLNQTTQFMFSINTLTQQQKINSQIINTTNQTFWTFAVFWTNYGFVDFTETEYTVSVQITPLKAVLQSQHLQCTDDGEEEEVVLLSTATDGSLKYSE